MKTVKEQFVEMMGQRFGIKVSASLGSEYVHRIQEAITGREFELVYPLNNGPDFVILEVESSSETQEDAKFILTFLPIEEEDVVKMVSFTEIFDGDRLSDVEVAKELGGVPNFFESPYGEVSSRSFRFDRSGKYPFMSEISGIDALCFDLYKEGEYTQSVCVQCISYDGKIIPNGWVFKNEALILSSERKQQEEALAIRSAEGLLPFISGDMDAPENEVVYRVEGADGRGMYHSKQAGGIHREFEIPSPSDKLINLSKEGFLFAFNSLEDLMNCTYGLNAKYFRRGAKIRRIKYIEIVKENCQCVVRA